MLGKTAVSLLGLLSAHDDAELGLISSSHSNLQCTTEPRPRRLPAAVADAQGADMGLGHLRCLPLLRAGAPCRQQVQQVPGGSETLHCSWNGGVWGQCRVVGCCKGWTAPQQPGRHGNRSVRYQARQRA